MKPMEVAYNLVLNAMSVGLIPLLRFKSGGDTLFFNGRLGRYDFMPIPGTGPRIWFHAVSVGEVNGAVPTLRAVERLLPDASLFLTVGTPTGFRHALSRISDIATVLPFPLDFPSVLHRAFNVLQPDLYVTFEGEFWPNLFRRLKRAGVPAVLLNGRLSRRSAAGYYRLGSLYKDIFRQFHRLAMLTEEDRRNVSLFGVDPARIQVLGSSKYDGLPAGADPAKVSRWRGILGLSPGTPVVVGGSLRGRERTEIPDVFLSLLDDRPEAVGIFAPRHLEHIPAMATRLKERGVSFRFLSDMERGAARDGAPVILVDRMGALFDLYGLGNLIFCGGTIEPVGGHNILEPSAWGKAVFYGPHVEKVMREHEMLQAVSGGFRVEDARDLLERWRGLLPRLSELESSGAAALEALKKSSGAAGRQAELVVEALGETAAREWSSHAAD